MRCLAPVTSSCTQLAAAEALARDGVGSLGEEVCYVFIGPIGVGRVLRTVGLEVINCNLRSSQGRAVEVSPSKGFGRRA